MRKIRELGILDRSFISVDGRQESTKPSHYIFKEDLIMKDFLVKHPFISFLMVDTVVCGVVNIVNILKNGKPFCRIQINTEKMKED